MRKPLIQSLLLFAIGAGCTVTKPPIGSPSIETAAPAVPEQVLIGTPLITMTGIPLSTVDSSSQQKIISPQLINICPESQLVSFEEIGLPNNLRLLLLPNTVDSYPQAPSKPLSVSSENPSPTTIIDDELYDYAVSPDYKWIYFNRPSIDENYPVLWISSLDGSEQWPVIDLGGNDYAGYASWVSDQEIFIIGSPHENEISVLDPWEYMPFMAVNPFTLEKRILTYLARNQEDGVFYYGAFNLDKRLLGMYGRLNRVDFIYDYGEDKTLPVFSWLETVDPFDMQFIKPIWVYDEGKFAITIVRPYGIDLAFNLDLQSASESKQYSDVMERIIFPEHLLPASVLGIVPDNNLIGLQKYDFFNSSQGENWFYVLDYNNQIIYDYCFNLQNLVKLVKFSPDGKFAAFSLENLATEIEQDERYVAILNLENGKVTKLKGYVLVDWGFVAP